MSTHSESEEQRDFIAYYRVSTQKQGQSGLGLEAQRAAVRGFVRDGRLVAEFTEVESGKRDNRPQLAAAIQYAKAHKARLVIAKLDRLSRNVAFIFQLKDSEVDFVCADMPDATTMNIGIFAVLAQHERELISKRTKDALAAKKARGFKLGTPANLTHAHRLKGAAAMAAKSRENENNRRAAALAAQMRAQGESLGKIAAKLNTSGFKTARGEAFMRTTVSRVLRYAA